MSSLHKACLHGDLTIVTKCLEMGQDPMATDEKNVTPLMLASTSSPDIVRLLLQDKEVITNIDMCDNVNWTALHYACRFNQAEIVKMLLDAHIDHSIEATDGVDSTALDIAYRYKNVNCVQEFVKWRYERVKNL
jgi:ankyrin repeat protein